MSLRPPIDRDEIADDLDESAEMSLPPRRRRRVRGVIMALCWIYAAFVVGLWILFRSAGDSWWVATVLMCGPRWMWAAPLVVLAPAAFLGARRGLWVLGGSAILSLFLVMDLRLPWRAWTTRTPSGPVLRVLTCNAHLTSLDPDALRKFIADTSPQVVVIQESSAVLQSKIFVDGVWYLEKDAEFCVASRYPVHKMHAVGQEKWLGGLPAFAFEIDTPLGVVPILDVHLISPHLPFRMTLHRSPAGPAEIERNSAQRLMQAREVREYANAIGSSVVVAGDFNTPADSPVYQETLSGLSNAFHDAGIGFGWTYYAKVPVTRIAHVLTGSDWKCQRCWVGPSVGSPHRPLVADLVWIGGKHLPPVGETRGPAAKIPVVEPEAVSPTPLIASPAHAIPAPAPVEPESPSSIARALREHRLAVGMSMEEAKQALADWHGPAEVEAELKHGWKMYLWTKGDERIAAKFDPSGQLRSLQKL